MAQEKKSHKVIRGVTLIIPEDWEPLIAEIMKREGYISLPELIRGLLRKKIEEIKREKEKTPA